MNYQDWLGAGNPAELVARVDARRGPQHRCGACQAWTDAVLLLDVSALPAECTGGARWVCDGCRTRWARELRPIEPGDAFLDPVEHTEKLHRLTGHDTAHLVPVVAARLARVRSDLEQRLAVHPADAEASRWQARLALIEQRIGPRPEAPAPIALSAETADAWLAANVRDPRAREYLRWLTGEVRRGRP